MADTFTSIVEAIRHEKQELHRRWGGTPISRALSDTLRVEVDHAARTRLRATSPALGHGIYHPHAKEGPLTLEGVAVYLVEHLPEPGWRIINPLRKA